MVREGCLLFLKFPKWSEELELQTVKKEYVYRFTLEALVNRVLLVHSNCLQVRQFLVVGRALPTEANPEPTLYRMRVFARDAVLARSKYWYHMKRQHKVRKV